MAARSGHAPLGERIPDRGDPDEVLDAFLGWVADEGLVPYAEQEQAILELLSGRHVVLATPTGSGKSLVALALHFLALAEGRRSFYTAPVKALVSEKFFALCDTLGAERVGMLTGDASINRDAPVVCATTEVLANVALREGARTDAPYVVLDEFHFYGDRDRGSAWQIPLITLPKSQFLLMSATLGNTDPLERRLAAFTGREVAHVWSDVRPVPLDFEYRETPLHETLDDLVASNLAPVYVVSFTQRECADLAQGLTSAKLASRDERRAIAEGVGDFRFDSPYGKDLKRFLSHGLGIHHAGLLPKYRLLVERLAQQGLLKAVFGTDTLGVGVNIPIRSVLFTGLSKFDGEKVGLLSVREFKQIAGRAGRKGFDDRGAVLCQAPPHVIENKRLAAKSAGKKPAKKKSAPQGFVAWNEETFRQLTVKPPEPLPSRFEVTHGLILSVLQRDDDTADYREVAALIERSHGSDAVKRRQRRRSAELFRSLRRAGIVEVVPASFGPPEVRVAGALQADFSLHRSLSLWLVEALRALDPDSPTYALELMSVVEACQENPRAILREQVSKLKGELIGQWKAEGVEYDERMRRLEEVTHPQPEEAFIRESFRLFAAHHPWVREEDVRPKSIAREMFEAYRGFHDTVIEYRLARSEGVLLRYLSQVHNALVKEVPDEHKDEAVYDAIAFFRTLLAGVDSSLVDTWESLLGQPADAEQAAPAAPRRFDLALHERALTARVRSELLALVRALSRGEHEQACALVRADPDAPWRAADFEAALAPFLAEYGEILFTPDARRAHRTLIKQTGPRTWDVAQVVVDPAGDDLWAIHGEIDLRQERDPEEPLVQLRRIGP